MRRLVLLAASTIFGCTGESGTRTAECSADPDQSEPEGLACAALLALQAEDADAYVALLVIEREDVVALAEMMDRPPPPPDELAEAAAREAAAAYFEDFLLQLRTAGIDPPAMELVATETGQAHREGDFGFAEEIDFTVRSGETHLRLRIDDCVFLRGRWLIWDGLRLQ